MMFIPAFSNIVKLCNISIHLFIDMGYFHNLTILEKAGINIILDKASIP